MDSSRYITLAALIFLGCEPLVTKYAESEDAQYYSASEITNHVATTSPKVMTWNIRFGVGRYPWFGDSCGERSIMTEDEVMQGLEAIRDFIKEQDPDIILVQEIDRESKRTGYIDQVQWILDNTDLNYGAYASMWDSQFIASDGLGMVDVGNAILSKYEISNAERIKLALRTDQDPLTQYFYLRRNAIRADIDVGDNSVVAVNVHATAFATDDTKQKHIDTFYSILEGIEDSGRIFVAGGDLNSIPPGAPQYDFCLEDRCEGEDCEVDEDGPHLEGSYFNNFDGELNLLQPFYENFTPAISQADAITSSHTTHSTWTTDSPGYSSDGEYWDRKLDYLFTNAAAGMVDGMTSQDAHQLSDHAPVSARLVLE